MKLLVYLSTLLVVMIFNFSQAKRLRKTLGGGMRQVGVLCAAACVALQENIRKLEDDHRKAKIFAGPIYLALTYNQIYVMSGHFLEGIPTF